MDTTDPRTDVARWEHVEAAVWRSAFDVVPDGLARRLGLSVEPDDDGVLAFHTSTVPAPMFNRLLGVGVDGPARPEALDRLLERFVRTGVPHVVPLAPGARPAELEGWLLERGFQRTTTLARMVRTVEALPPLVPSIRIRQVGVEEREVWARVLAEGMGMPAVLGEMMANICGQERWRTYLAYADGEPVGTGAIYVHGRIGWIGCGATLPAYRRRGIQGAMMTRRMHDLADLGCRWLQTETNQPAGDEPAPSFSNMRRLGFEVAYTSPNYVRARA